MNRRISMGGAVALGLSVFLAVPAAHAQRPVTTPTAPATTATIYVPSGFDTQLSDTRANGHYAVVGTGLHIWTDGSTDQAAGKNSDKVAEYVDTKTALSAVENPSLDFTVTDPSSAGVPGFQLVVDLDGNGTPDGILVGEPASYGNHWWLASASTTFDNWGAAPGAADGYDHSAPLADWTKAFPSAQVVAFGFSLGSGVLGDGTLNAIHFAGTTYTFANDVVLTSKDECKNGGWVTSTVPVYKNQGECVSHFATTTNSGKGSATGTGTGSGTVTGSGTATAPVAPAAVTPLNAGKFRAI